MDTETDFNKNDKIFLCSCHCYSTCNMAITYSIAKLIKTRRNAIRPVLRRSASGFYLKCMSVSHCFTRMYEDDNYEIF